MFSPAARSWFEASFGDPTAAQREGWPPIADGRNTLLLAPTGSGKTLAAFLWAIDRMAAEPAPERERRTRVLYISPLRALAVDIEKNLRAPLAGIQAEAERLGTPLPHVPTVGVRTGDTDARERRRLLRTPPDILITTPESLYLMLTSQARETLRSVTTVIVDEIHVMAATKRGAHLMLSLERLAAETQRPFQRIGLSATQRPLDEIARFLGGFETPGTPRDVAVVDAGVRKQLDLEVIVPIDDMSLVGRPTEDRGGVDQSSIWPSIHPVLLDLIRGHRSTIVFVNNRRSAERLASSLNDLAEEEIARAHHGSLAREQRTEVEAALKGGRLPAIVATSRWSSASTWARWTWSCRSRRPPRWRAACNGSGGPAIRSGRPAWASSSRSTAETCCRPLWWPSGCSPPTSRRRGTPATRSTCWPNRSWRWPQQTTWSLTDLAATVRRAAPFADLSDDVFRGVLDMLAGRYPSDAFAELRPRIVWDRTDDTIRAREGAGRLAIISGGTIPDRGLFGVFTTDGSRVGELDEECVYESRRGEVFLLGASSWRIEDITRDQVVVSPAPGEHGKLPFWKAPGPGRPVELGLAIGRFTRELHAKDGDDALTHTARGSRNGRARRLELGQLC